MADYVERKDKGWRGSKVGRPPEKHDHKGHIHLSSQITVEGRSPELFWTNARRNDFDRFVQLAQRFGLMVHELPPGITRKRRTTGRVDLDVAYAHIADDQGLFFDDWVRRVYLGTHPENNVTFFGAAQTARVALCKLHRDGRVEKRKTEEGRLRLYTTGHAPPIVKGR